MPPPRTTDWYPAGGLGRPAHLPVFTALGIGLAVAVLVDHLFAVTNSVRLQPKACGIGSRSAGALAGIPALLPGTAYCGPVLLAAGSPAQSVRGVLPIAALCLLGTLLMAGRRVQPDAI